MLFVGASLGPQFPSLVGPFVGSEAAGVAAVCAALGVLRAGVSVFTAGAGR